MQNQKHAYIYAAVVVLIWSTVATAFKLSLKHLDPLQLLLLADIVSVAALFLILLFAGKLPVIFRYSVKDIAFCAFLGVLNPFLYYTVLLKAYDLLPAQEAQPLNYTWAITLTILSIPLLRQKIQKLDIIAICISYFGVLVISTHGKPFSLEFSNLHGVLLALGSTIIWALYWIYNTRNTLDPIMSLFLNFLTAFPFILISVLVFSSFPELTAPVVFGGLYIGLFEMGVTFVLWLKALRLSESVAKTGNLIFFSPFLSLVFIHFFLGETIRWSSVAGLCFIITGNGIQKLRRR